MWKKIILLPLLGGLAMTAVAQIGYKGQVSLAAGAGINYLGGISAEARVGAYISPHSVLGVGGIWDRTVYNAGPGESFRVAQWLGCIQYQYVISINQLMILPSGGTLLGAENSDPITNLGNLVRYDRQFVYGFFMELGVEYVIGKHWALALTPRVAYLMNSSFEKVRLSACLGIKCYF